MAENRTTIGHKPPTVSAGAEDTCRHGTRGTESNELDIMKAERPRDPLPCCES